MGTIQKIPKILHLYWGCNMPLSYLRFLTVLSFHYHHPSWKIIVHIPKQTTHSISWATHENSICCNGKDWFFELLKLDYVEASKNISEKIINDCQYLPEVHKSDLLRWVALRDIGGVWSDFDILYVRSIVPVLKQALSFPKFDAGVCVFETKRKRLNLIGFLFSVQNSDVFSKAYRIARGRINEKKNSYQKYGREILDTVVFHRRCTGLYKIDPMTVYPCVNQYDIWDFDFGLIDTIKSNDSIKGVHWYGGHYISSCHEIKMQVNNNEDTTINRLYNEFSKD